MANPNSFEAMCSQFAEQISATMAVIIKEFSAINTSTKPRPEHQRKVLICGYNEDEDYVCIEASSKWSVCNDIDDDDGVALICEEEERSSVEDPIEQSFKNSKEQFVEMDERQVFDKMTERQGDHEEDDHKEFQAKTDDSKSTLTTYRPVHQVRNESVHDMLHRQVDNSMVQEFCSNKKGLHIDNKVFDKIPERRRYIASLNPDPPDDYDQHTPGGTIEQLDPMHLWLQRVELLKSGLFDAIDLVYL